MTGSNADAATVAGFGDEWSRFDQTGLSEPEALEIFDAYFRQFPWEVVGPGAVGADIGCGSGRWARFVAPRVGHLLCVDASPEAAAVARRNLLELGNVSIQVASVGALPYPPRSLDFAYSLGVLDHVPDTAAGISACVETLKPGAPFLVYLYYAFDNRPGWYRGLWQITDVARRILSRAPYQVRSAITDVVAITVYWPLARFARVLARLGVDVERLPLTFYRDRSLYVMRTDARDRFGTRLEHRFSRAQVERMLRDAGLADIQFNEHAPYWVAVGRRSPVPVRGHLDPA